MKALKERLRKNQRFILIFGAILVLLSLILTFVLEDFVRNTIVRPLAYMAWFIEIILSALPGRWFISIASVIVIFIAFGSLRSQRKPAATSSSSSVSLHDRTGPIRIWQQRLSKLEQRRYSSSVFTEHLFQLLMSLLAIEHRMSQKDLIAACEKGTILLPDYVMDFILTTSHRDSSGRLHRSWLGRWWAHIKAIMSGKREHTLFTETLNLEPILDYMESELHLTH